MAEVSEFFNNMPLFTRYWFGASLAVPLLSRFGLLNPFYMILTNDFLTKMQLWRPVTALLYYPLTGNKGFHYLMNLYFIYNYSKRLENGHFYSRPADYLFMLLFNWFSLNFLCQMLSFLFNANIHLLMDPMVLSVIYVYCILNQDQIVQFWFGTQFKARYLPWVLFGMNFVLGGGGHTELLGIIVGHLYYFVTIRYPQDQGITLVETPQILHSYFPSSNNNNATAGAPQPPRTTPFTAPGANRTPTSSSGHNWGRGRRLEDSHAD